MSCLSTTLARLTKSFRVHIELSSNFSCLGTFKPYIYGNYLSFRFLQVIPRSESEKLISVAIHISSLLLVLMELLVQYLVII